LFKKILIANRGEIAVRIIRACKELGVQSVAIHSDVDTDAMHVKLADESVCVGGALPNLSYLNIPNIMSAINITGADAVHPGYGFLSENDKFAKILHKHEVKFIGPSSKSILALGNKSNALKIAYENNLPILGNKDAQNINSTKEASKIAKEIGMPIVIKAAYGGGGKGMRVFNKESEINQYFSQLKTEAKNYFGDDTMYAEKFLTNAKHIEFQVISDPKNKYAKIIGQRDCSIQRKNQKIIEEVPSDFVKIKNLDEIEKNIEELLITNEYEGLGTLEFLYQDNQVYFIEMNTRLQVEHPVTEMVSGLDLVSYQIDVAHGGSLPEETEQRGHSLEARLNAEDAYGGYMPQSGPLLALKWPNLPHVRIDSGVEEGGEISTHYDSMIAKVIVWGETREIARKRLIHALEETVLLGIKSNQNFLIDILKSDFFISGDTYTTTVEANEWNAPETPEYIKEFADTLRHQAPTKPREMTSWETATRR